MAPPIKTIRVLILAAVVLSIIVATKGHSFAAEAGRSAATQRDETCDQNDKSDIIWLLKFVRENYVGTRMALNTHFYEKESLTKLCVDVVALPPVEGMIFNLRLHFKSKNLRNIVATLIRYNNSSVFTISNDFKKNVGIKDVEEVYGHDWRVVPNTVIGAARSRGDDGKTIKFNSAHSEILLRLAPDGGLTSVHAKSWE